VSEEEVAVEKDQKWSGLLRIESGRDVEGIVVWRAGVELSWWQVVLGERAVGRVRLWLRVLREWILLGGE